MRLSTPRWNGSTGSITTGCGADLQHPTSGEGNGVLSANGRVGDGGLTQSKKSPACPGLFKQYGEARK